MVLRRQASIGQVAVRMPPLAQPPVIKEFQLVCNDKWHLPVRQTFLEQNQPAHAPVPVLKRMDTLETDVEIKQVVQRLLLFAMIRRKQRLHRFVYFFRRTSLAAAHLVRKPFVIPHSKPIPSAIRRPRLQHAMQMFHEILRQRLFHPLYNEVDAAEMVHRFHNIVYVDCLVRHAQRIRLEDIPGLVVRQPAPLDMVRIIRQVDLRPVVNPALQPHLLFLAEDVE